MSDKDCFYEEREKTSTAIATISQTLTGIDKTLCRMEETHKDMWSKINHNEIQIEIVRAESKGQARNIALIISAIAGIVTFAFNYVKGEFCGK